MMLVIASLPFWYSAIVELDGFVHILTALGLVWN